MTPDTSFESMYFSLFSTKEYFVDNDQNPAVNFYA